MQINHIYSKADIKKSGLKSSIGTKVGSVIYKKQNKVYFFEEIKRDTLRLHSIIHEKSFYL